MRENRYIFGGAVVIVVIGLSLVYSHSLRSAAPKNILPARAPTADVDHNAATDKSKPESIVSSPPAGKFLPGQPALNPPDFSDLATTDRPPLADELGSAGSSPDREPAIMLKVLDAYRRILGAYPAGENNRQFVNALLGANAQKLPFIPRDHPRLNGNGEIVDAWGTPFFFHLNSQTSIEVRSAGPDRIMFSSDDLIAGKANRNIPEQ